MAFVCDSNMTGKIETERFETIEDLETDLIRSAVLSYRDKVLTWAREGSAEPLTVANGTLATDVWTVQP